MNLAEPISPMEAQPAPHAYYPTLHLSKVGEEIDLPDEGVLTVTFKKIRSEESKNADGKERYSCTLELHDIRKVKEEKGCCSDMPKKDKYAETGDVLDQLRAALAGEGEDESEDESED